MEMAIRRNSTKDRKGTSPMATKRSRRAEWVEGEKQASDTGEALDSLQTNITSVDTVGR